MMQGVLEEELQGRAGASERALGTSLAHQFLEIAGHLCFGGLLGRDPGGGNELPHGLQIAILGALGQAGQLKILDHLLLDAAAHGRLPYGYELAEVGTMPASAGSVSRQAYTAPPPAFHLLPRRQPFSPTFVI
jgi:hypothetical protein